jgi:hypothetical protein
MRTVSSATRKMERQRATNASKVRNGSARRFSEKCSDVIVLGVVAIESLCWSGFSILASITEADAMLGAVESEAEQGCDTTEHSYGTLVASEMEEEEGVVWDGRLQALSEVTCLPFSTCTVAMMRSSKVGAVYGCSKINGGLHSCSWSVDGVDPM